MHERPPSFTDLLPWTSYLPETKTFVLDDGFSVGAAFELLPIGTEAASAGFLADIRDALQSSLLDALPEDPSKPWILQFYLQDDYDLTTVQREIAAYAPGGRSDYADFYGELFSKHLQRIADADGAFVDELASNRPWRGKIRRVRATLYQRATPGMLTLGDDPEHALHDTVARFEQALDVAGIIHKRLDLKGFREWLLPWFNPAPPFLNGSSQQLVDLAGRTPEPVPLGYDVGQDLAYSQPSSDAARGTWLFNDRPHQIVSVQGLRRVPDIGLLSAERWQGDRCEALFDNLPMGTIAAITVVAQSQHEVATHVARIKKAAVGDSAEAALTRENVDAIDRELARGNKLFPTTIAFYVRGGSFEELQANRNQLCVTLLANGLQPIAEEADLLTLDSYLRNLPMAYDPHLESQRRRSSLMFVRDIAHLAPVYGRARSVGQPGFVFFNRGAEPWCVDPLAKSDRKKNAHVLVLGPSGSGKSATLVYLLQQAMARHRPRLFIIEAGNSFELLSAHFKAHGLSVNHIKLEPSADVSLPPFLHAKTISESYGSPDDTRDHLGEMEIIARIMITGGDAREQERLTRADRMLIRQAILDAGRDCAIKNAETLTENVVSSMRTASQSAELPENRRARAREMADSMALFTSGVAGRFYNRPGTAMPDVDVTLFEIGLLAREGYEDQLTVAYLTLMSHINDLVERHQQSARQTLVVTDEGHVVLTHPLLANYVVKITKMWRKFGAWYWIATQNLADFPDQSKRMLNMIEWWLCLAMPKDEIDQVGRFRELTPGQRALLDSTRKEPGKYVEGVMLSDEHQALFRNVPPALSLALAMTEKHEKAERREIMDRTGCSEYEAACEVAERIGSQQTS